MSTENVTDVTDATHDVEMDDSNSKLKSLPSFDASAAAVSRAISLGNTDVPRIARKKVDAYCHAPFSPAPLRNLKQHFPRER